MIPSNAVRRSRAWASSLKDWITQVSSQHKDRFTQPQNVRMAGAR
jgi:hypothetical protein